MNLTPPSRDSEFFPTATHPCAATAGMAAMGWLEHSARDLKTSGSVV